MKLILKSGPVRPCRLFVPYNFFRQCRPCVRSVFAVRPCHAPSVRVVKPHHYHRRRQPPNKLNYRDVMRRVSLSRLQCWHIQNRNKKENKKGT